MPVLDAALVERPEAARRFLNAAIALPIPDLAGLVASGVPLWDAQAMLRRLSDAGEITTTGWTTAALGHYRTRVGESPRGPAVDLAVVEMPREKALRGGIEVLDDAELIALLLRTGTADAGVIALARRLLDDHAGLVGLARLSPAQLAGCDGLGPAKAGELAAAFELARRLAAAAMRARPVLARPDAVAALVAPAMAGLDHEQLWCLAIDARLGLIGEPRVCSKGDVDGTDGSPRLVFRHALAAGASSCIVVHNHPTGDPTPSTADRSLTARLVQAGRMLDLPLNDHLVIGAAGAWVSIRATHPECFR